MMYKMTVQNLFLTSSSGDFLGIFLPTFGYFGIYYLHILDLRASYFGNLNTNT